MKIIKWLKKNKVKATILFLILISIIGMWWTGTLSYPYILVDRQIELIKYCSIDKTKEFDTAYYGFHISGPENYCILPHRIFPAEASIQVIPDGNYSVINEYAVGSVAVAAQATILFEKTEVGRTPKELIARMGLGGFLDEATVTEYDTKNKLHVYFIKNAKGIEDGSKARFDWALIVHPNGKILTTILTSHPDTPEVFNYIVDHISAIE